VSSEHLYLGKSGEEIAVNFLKNSGYRVLMRNYKTKLGEIDIIAKDQDTLAFIEVKTRHSDRFGLPSEAVSEPKQRQISKVALSFLKEKGLLHKKARFDVVSIIYSSTEKPKIDLIKDAFDLDPRYAY
jgi:putative endonuclease